MPWPNALDPGSTERARATRGPGAGPARRQEVHVGRGAQGFARAGSSGQAGSVLPSAGSQAPRGAVVESLDPSAAPIDLGALASDGPALLVFLRADCPASEAAAPVLPRFASIGGLAVAAVSQDDREETARFARTYGWTEAMRTLLDPEPWPASNAWGVAVTPTFVLLAPGGTLEAVAEGWSRDEANGLAARATELLGSPPVEVSRPGDGPAFRPG